MAQRGVVVAREDMDKNKQIKSPRSPPPPPRSSPPSSSPIVHHRSSDHLDHPRPPTSLRRCTSPTRVPDVADTWHITSGIAAAAVVKGRLNELWDSGQQTMHMTQPMLVVGIGTVRFTSNPRTAMDIRVLFLVCSFQFQFLNEGQAVIIKRDKVGKSFHRTRGFEVIFNVCICLRIG